MDEATRDRIITSWLTLPDELRGRPATEQQLRVFESRFSPIPPEFRWFLLTLGGGPVGCEWVDGISELSSTHEKFNEEFGPPRGWTMAGIFVIGWDGWGNPYGIERETGKVLVEDHNFGGIHEMASSFEAFLVRGLCHDEIDQS